MAVPKTASTGRRHKHAQPSFPPVQVADIAADEGIPWERHALVMGSKGLITADVKCIRWVSCESTTEFGNYMAPGGNIWLYIRRYDNDDIKYFVCNAPSDTPIETLDKLATVRRSIEQCFGECKPTTKRAHGRHGIVICCW